MIAREKVIKKYITVWFILARVQELCLCSRAEVEINNTLGTGYDRYNVRGKNI